jgi:hypothetical protein
VDAALPLILEDADAKLSGAARMLLAQRKLELDHFGCAHCYCAFIAGSSAKNNTSQ